MGWKWMRANAPSDLEIAPLMRSRFYVVFCGALVCCGTVTAMTIVPPRNYAELARHADAVVLAAAGRSTAVKRGSMILTETEFTVLQAVKGPLEVGELFTVEKPGGEVDGDFWVVPGSPSFELAASYLICLSRKDEDVGDREVWLPTMLSYGVFEDVTGASGQRILVPLPEGLHGVLRRPDGDAVEPLMPLARDALLLHLRSVLANRSEWSGGTVRAADGEIAVDSRHRQDVREGGGAGFPAACSFFESGGRQFRWDSFDDGGRATIYANSQGDPSLRDGGFWVVQEAMDLWMNITDTSFNLVFGGARAVSPTCSREQDGVNRHILFDDPCSDISDLDGCSGILAYGGPRGSGSHTSPGDGDIWWSINGWIVVVNNGAGCLGFGNYRVMLAHELGHGLGFGHVEDANALMYANCCRNVNVTDRLCARFTYPAADPNNARPRADAGSNISASLVGNSLRLSGSVSDDGVPGGPLEVSWSRLAGPGTVTFTDDSSCETTASFSESGRYLLGFLVYDGELLHVDQVEIDVEVFVGMYLRTSFQQGVDGYDGAVDTFLLERSPRSDRGADSELEVDGDDPRGTGQESQGLIRFERIFGEQPGQLPVESAIRGAWLELVTTNDGDGGAFHRMVQSWSDSTTWSSQDGADGVQAGDEARSARDAVVPGSGEPVLVEVTTSLEAWARDPDSNFGWAILPLGDDGWDFYSSEGAVPPKLVVEYPMVQQTRLIELGDSWRFFRGSRAPPVGWANSDFVPDGAWLEGATGIGYGDGDDRTVLADMEDSYLTVYCRREFDTESAGLIGRLMLSIDYDDGFVAYLNGGEVARSGNMGIPGSPVTRSTEASSGHEAGVPEVFSLDPGVLRSGRNVLAVEVHNAGISSSDLSFRPELVGEVLLIPGGSRWRYLRGVAAFPSEWASVGFDDSLWSSGRTGIGYGDGDDVTELLDMEGRYLSIACRRSFVVDCPRSIGSMRMTVVYDDGFVAYLNGEEIARGNMPAGVVRFDTAASRSLEPTPESFEVPVKLLRSGRNVLSVSVHNFDIDSSDLTFMAVLVPFLDVVGDGDCEGGPVPRFRRGDVGNDGVVDVSDAVRLLLSLFAAGGLSECRDAGDVDDDGVVNVTDAVSLLAYLFQSGGPPSFPGTSCGEDPTPDGLGFCAFTGCGD